MNKLSRARLPDSKWTHRVPEHEEKHFTIVRVLPSSKRDSKTIEASIEMRSLLSKASRIVPLSELRDDARWLPGWR